MSLNIFWFDSQSNDYRETQEMPDETYSNHKELQNAKEIQNDHKEAQNSKMTTKGQK